MFKVIVCQEKRDSEKKRNQQTNFIPDLSHAFNNFCFRTDATQHRFDFMQTGADIFLFFHGWGQDLGAHQGRTPDFAWGR